jgi:hypothetical protein
MDAFANESILTFFKAYRDENIRVIVINNVILLNNRKHKAKLRINTVC